MTDQKPSQVSEQAAPLSEPTVDRAAEVQSAPPAAELPTAGVSEGLTASAPEPVPEPASEIVVEKAAEPQPAADAKPWGASGVSAAVPRQPVAAPARGGSFFAPLLGGAIALGAGFAASHFDVLKLRPVVDTAAIEARIAAVDQRVSDAAAANGGVAQQLDALSAAVTEHAAEATQLRAMAVSPAQLNALETRIADFEAALSSLPAGSDGAAVAALATMRADLDRARADIAALASAPPTSAVPDAAAVQAMVGQEMARWQDDMAAAAKAEADSIRAEAARDVARSALAEAIRTGTPWQDLLAPAGIDPVPPALSAHAANGLPDLNALSLAYAAPAREALDLLRRAEAMAGDRSATDRMLSFLALQTGARSLAPREGDGPDAVLSRVEALLRAGDLAGALAGLDTLPPEGAAPFAAWRADVEARLAAEAALAAEILPK